MNIGIVTDSNSGITQAEAKSLGIRVIPMPFTIADKEYFEEIDLSQEEFYEKLNEGDDIFTSQPAAASVMDLWDEMLKEYDEIVHIPMSSGLSGSCQTALMLAEDYDNKIHVVNNQRISVTQRQSVLDAIKLSKEGKTAEEIKNILERDKLESSIYIMVDTLKYLKKGGRITAAGAAIGTVLNIKPVLQIQGDKLDAYAKVRGIKQAKKVMLDAIKRDVETRFPDLYKEGRLQFAVAHTQNYEAVEELKNEVMEIFKVDNVVSASLPLSIACHIGPGSLAVTCTIIE